MLRLTSGFESFSIRVGFDRSLASWLSLEDLLGLLASLCWNLTSFLGFVILDRVSRYSDRGEVGREAAAGCTRFLGRSADRRSCDTEVAGEIGSRRCYKATEQRRWLDERPSRMESCSI